MFRSKVGFKTLTLIGVFTFTAYVHADPVIKQQFAFFSIGAMLNAKAEKFLAGEDWQALSTPVAGDSSDQIRAKIREYKSICITAEVAKLNKIAFSAESHKHDSKQVKLEINPEQDALRSQFFNSSSWQVFENCTRAAITDIGYLCKKDREDLRDDEMNAKDAMTDEENAKSTTQAYDHYKVLSSQAQLNAHEQLCFHDMANFTLIELHLLDLQKSATVTEGANVLVDYSSPLANMAATMGRIYFEKQQAKQPPTTFLAQPLQPQDPADLGSVNVQNNKENIGTH